MSWKKSFPHLTKVRLYSNDVITDTEFKELSHVSELDISYCENLKVSDKIFAEFKLKKLHLKGRYKLSGRIHYFTDELCNYLTDVEEFSIDYNEQITNQGLQKLKKLKWLTMERCDRITAEGFVNCSGLTYLRLSCMDVSDAMMYHVPKLEILHVNRGNLTSSKIISLKNLCEVGFTCIHIDCVGFDQLIHLKKASFSHNPSIYDDQLMYLAHIEELLLYSCPKIHGEKFHSLKNIKYLYIYETPLETKYMSTLIHLTNATDILLSRCHRLSASYMKRLEVDLPVLRYLP